jgi:N-acyl homoserine lactone hydrolase
MRLYLLYLGTMQPAEVPVPGYLIQMADGINILVDTGWPRSFVDHPQNPPGLSIEIRPEDTVSARLAAIGLQPSNIGIVVCTHLDDDHCGNHDLFGSAEFVVQREILPSRARKLLRTPAVVRRVNRTAGGVMVGAGFAVVAAR